MGTILQLERDGMMPDAARAEANRVMGNETLMREDARGVWLSVGVESVLNDWRYAWRALLRSRAFTGALVVAAAGLYGIIAYAVSQRTREIGVRVALGADSTAVARLVLGDSVRLLTAGCGVGLVSVYATSRLLSGFLYEVRPTDPTALLAAVALLAIVAFIATLVPIRRALGVDPMDALRAD